MPPLLSDPSPTFYAILIILVAAMAFLWIRSRKRGDLIRFVAAAAVLLAVFLIDRFVESPREETTRKMREMSAATKAKKIDDVAKHLSDTFDYNGSNKQDFLSHVKLILAMAEVNGIDVDSFSRKDFETIDDKRVKVRFDTWPTGYGVPEYRYSCWATFVKDLDGQYRMQTFALYRHSDEKQQVVPPQLK